MSVSFFDVEELGNVAALLGEEYAEELAAYSVGNAWAYNRQYERHGAKAEAWTAAQIRAFMPSPMNCERARARGTLRLLSYNGATNAGTELDTVEYHRAVAALMTTAYAQLLDLHNAECYR